MLRVDSGAISVTRVLSVDTPATWSTGLQCGALAPAAGMCKDDTLALAAWANVVATTEVDIDVERCCDRIFGGEVGNEVLPILAVLSLEVSF